MGSFATVDALKFSRAIAYFVYVVGLRVAAIRGFSSKNSSADAR